MEPITVYLGFGLLFVFIFDKIGQWSSPHLPPFKGREKVVLSLIWPLALLAFAYFLIIEILKLKK